MANPTVKLLTDNSTDGLEKKIEGALTGDPDLLLYGPPTYNAGARMWVQALVKNIMIADGGGIPSASDISDATATGVALMTAVDALAARAAIGAGTSNLAIGTTGATAKAGNWTPTLDDVQGMTDSGKEFVSQPNYTAMRDLLDLGGLAILDAITLAQISDASANGRALVAAADYAAMRGLLGLGALATVDGVTAAQISDATNFMRTLLTTGVNEATLRNLLELGQLATLNEVTAAQISDGTITNSEISNAAAIGATKIAVAANANGVVAGNLQATIDALAARIDALEP